MKRCDFRTGPVKSEKGFTLIEIILAIMLLVVALLGMISVTTMVIKGNSFSRMMTTATTLAKDKMEYFNNKSYAELTKVPITDTELVSPDYATSGGTVQTSATGAYFRRRWTLMPNPPDTNMTRMAIIEVRVEWPQQSPTHNVTVNTIVAAGN